LPQEIINNFWKHELKRFILVFDLVLMVELKRFIGVIINKMPKEMANEKGRFAEL
jgi:hypothetical protein